MTTTKSRIPLAVKIVYTAFMTVLIPKYWQDYGPQNFLAFCDVALLVTLVGIWIESPLLIGTQAVAILLPQGIWVVDILGHLAGFKMLGMTDYMFNPGYPLFTRLLSTFHGWLPLLLIWVVRRIGYDRRALAVQTVAGVLLLVICYTCFDPPGTAGSKRAFNLNYVFGMTDGATQTRFPPLEWFGFLVVGLPLLIYVPTHFLVRWLIAPADSGAESRAGLIVDFGGPDSPPANPADQHRPEPFPSS